MRTRLKILLAAATATLAAAAFAAVGVAGPADLTNVPSAEPKSPGFAAPNVLSPQLSESVVAQGSDRLDGGTAAVPYYGYDGNGPHVPPAGSTTEASKTEPDKNTYLILKGQTGPTQGFAYGTHFVFQGHETGTTGYITRINLDASGDPTHRVTLMATTDTGNAALPVFDGSTWDPWAKRLLFTAERGNAGGVWQATASYPSQVEDVSAVLGRGGYEGIQNDSQGNLYIVEDVGGPAGSVNDKAKQPNSFVYRFLPSDKTNLNAGGKLQALQVISQANPGQPIAFHAGQADADITSQDTKDLNTYGKTFTTHWVTIHDTATDPPGAFDANAAAKSHNATPFKRPENGAFRPDGKFKEFYFDATGDTNAQSQANAQYGGWGGIFKLMQDPKSNDGKLTLFYAGDQAHTGLDNAQFLTKDKVVFVEDAGDLLHTQRNALDSGYVFDSNTDYSVAANQPLRMMAEGRDPSATLDSGLLGQPGFKNDGDNEITGFHVSNGDPSTEGILGAEAPKPWQNEKQEGWRVFWTQQHGDNVTYEITAS